MDLFPFTKSLYLNTRKLKQLCACVFSFALNGPTNIHQLVPLRHCCLFYI